MKAKNLLPLSLCMALLTACGSSEYSSSSASYDGAAEVNSSYYSYDSAEDVSFDSEDAEGYDAASDSSGDEDGITADSIKKEMLVYTCDMTVDVLDFDTAVDKFKESLDSYGGFVESENYSDGGSTGRWYSDDQEKWRTYSATVRVPSSDYDDFCEAAAELGDLRSKNASVQNVSSEYYDLSTTLEIYEAKEERYIALLAGITDDEYAVTVERELTDLQIEIAKIKTRMNEIRTDVAYSFVNITVNEVKEYTPEPVKKDTFGQRLKNRISDTASNFLIFLEGLLFVIISLLPYLVLIGIIVFVTIKVKRKIKKRRTEKNESHAQKQMTEINSNDSQKTE